MKIYLIIILILFWTNLFSQDCCDKEIYTYFLTPTANLKADTIFNKKGKIDKIIQPTIDNLVVERFTNRISKKVESYELLIKSGLTDLDSSTYSDFKEKNWESFKIDSVYVSNRLIYYIDNVESKRIIETNDWLNFNKKYSNAKLIISFSKIGYNRNKTQALLYTTNNNCLAGKYGFYILYEFKNEKWTVLQSNMVFL